MAERYRSCVVDIPGLPFVERDPAPRRLTLVCFFVPPSSRSTSSST